jgi:hypothetical protein
MTPARKKFLVVFGYAATLLLCYGLLSVSQPCLIFYGLEVGKWLFYGLLVVALLVALIRFVKWVWNWDSHHQRG